MTVRDGGPTLAEDGTSIVGLLLTVEAPSRGEAQAFMADSPYGKANLFADLQIRQWDWMTGHPGLRRSGLSHGRPEPPPSGTCPRRSTAENPEGVAAIHPTGIGCFSGVSREESDSACWATGSHLDPRRVACDHRMGRAEWYD